MVFMGPSVGSASWLRKCMKLQVERAIMQPMRKRQLSWDDLRIALAVQRGSSHGAASRFLGIDPTTVGRRIAALESALGARLFDRTPSGLEATVEGRTLLARAEKVEEEILSVERELGGADARLSGTVRVTSGDGYQSYVLIPALADLRRQHPGITVELRAETRSLDLTRREADVALRIARPTEPNLVARKIGAMRYALYASRAYLDRRGSPRTARDLAEHDFIGFDASLDRLPQVRWLVKAVSGLHWAVRTTSTVAQVLACIEGQGIALLGTFIAPREPRLVPVLPSLGPTPREVFVVSHRDVRKSARIDAVVEWLARTGPALDA